MSVNLFIRRPILSIVISVVITLVGLLAIPNMAVTRFPDLAPPTILVSATYPGADAVTVEETVASVIEQEVNGAEHMIYMQSKAANDGTYQLTISFEVGTDIDLAAVEVQNRVSQANVSLPEEVIRNGVSVAKQSTQILMVASVYSPDQSLDKLFLSNYATLNLKDPLSRVPGVGGVELRVGAADYSMRVWVEPDRLRRLGVTAGDLAAALREQNLQAATGSVGQPPQESGLEVQYPVLVKGGLNQVEEFANIIVKTTETGEIVRLRDVARVELGAESYTTFGRRNGVDAIPILIYQRPGANALEVAQAVEEELDRLRQTFPEGLDVDMTFDTTLAVDASISDVVRTLVEAFLLVVLVIFTFLGNYRATFIPLLAVPVSLIGTFAILHGLGFSINTFTLFGMVLAIGIVVDDAIVVVEAVEHHIEEGLSPREATEQAMSEVAGPVVAMALVLASVFVPVTFLGGLTGQLYQQFAVTLSASVCLSAVVALTLTPALCSLLLKPRTKLWGPFGWYIAVFEKVFGWALGGYSRVIGVAVRRLFLTVLVMIGIYSAVGALHRTLPTGFIPPEDNGYLLISVSLPPGASLERNSQAVAQIEAILEETAGVENFVVLGGLNILTGNAGQNYASSFIILEPWSERRDPSLSAEALQGALMQRFAALPELQALVINPPPVPGLGLAGGFVFELQDRSGGTPAELERVSQEFLAQARQDPDLVGLFTPFNTAIPQVFLDLDRDRIKRLGIPLNEVFTTLQMNLGGAYINLFNRFGRTWRVYLQAESDFRRTPEDIGRLYVRGRDESMVPLSAVSSVQMTTGPDLLLRYNLYRTAEVYGSAAPGVSSGQAINSMERLADQYLPDGYGYEWTGTAYQEKESTGQQVQIIFLALLFVFLFLSAQYESWAAPFSIILGLPIGILGAYLGTFLAGLDNNIYVQIGIITLLGLAAKNAILIVEFAKTRYDNGMSLREATLEGSKLRFRPILMTSFAFILGVVPLALATGAGAAGQGSLGIAVASGMTFATVIGVFVIPSLFVLVMEISERLSGKRRPSLEPSP